jgi:hypothetical protein
MVEGDLLPDADFDWYYFRKVRDTMVPLSLGCVPVLNGKNEDLETT